MVRARPVPYTVTFHRLPRSCTQRTTWTPTSVSWSKPRSAIVQSSGSGFRSPALTIRRRRKRRAEEDRDVGRPGEDRRRGPRHDRAVKVMVSGQFVTGVHRLSARQNSNIPAHGVRGGQYQERQERAGPQASDHRGGGSCRHVGSDAGFREQGQQTEHGRGDGHNQRANAQRQCVLRAFRRPSIAA